MIEQIKIKRWFKTSSTSDVSLHGFCDSSEEANAAAIYIVQKDNDKTTSSLVCSKTRVTKLRSVSIPRLELCGAVLLAKLMKRVTDNFKIEKQKIFLWTDSTVVLVWLSAHASRWQTFIAHRVSEIHKIYQADQWQHVRTYDNPADIASRGSFPSDLVNNQLWFHGPPWLLCNSDQWPKTKLVHASDVNLEEKIPKQQVNIISKPSKELEFLLRYSKLTRLLRATAHLFRFVQYLRNKQSVNKSKGFITPDELVKAKISWIKYIQKGSFQQEIQKLSQQTSVEKQSPLYRLNPQLENGSLIIRGRLELFKFKIARKTKLSYHYASQKSFYYTVNR